MVTVKSNIFEQEQLEEEQNVEDRSISCKVLRGEVNEVCFYILCTYLINYVFFETGLSSL